MYYLQFKEEADIYGPFKDLDEAVGWAEGSGDDYKILSPLSPEEHDPRGTHVDSH
jgi:hypothetical protein